MNPSTSRAQIEANGANARSHGLCSCQLHHADDEAAAVFASLRHALSPGLALEGELELTHFEALLHAKWNLRPCRMNEATLLASHSDLNTSRPQRTFHRASRTNLADARPLAETARIRRALLNHARTKAALKKSISPPAAKVFGPRNGQISLSPQTGSAPHRPPCLDTELDTACNHCSICDKKSF